MPRWAWFGLAAVTALLTTPSNAVAVTRIASSGLDRARPAQLPANSHRVKVVRGRRLRAPVDLRRLPRGRVRVAITVRLANGRTLRGARRYRTCATRQPHH